EASLQRLERETLIGRNGEDFFFLTNEERDISREIKDVDLSSAEETKLLAELLFEDVLKGQRKHRFPDNQKDFGLTRLCDLHPHGHRTDGDLLLSVITPLADDYGLYDETRCLLNSSAEGGALILKLPDDKTLAREIRTLIQTDKYVGRKNDGTASHTTLRILRERQEENRERRARLLRLLDQHCQEAAIYAAGQPVPTKASSAAQVVADGLNYLVRNSFNKLGYLSHLSANPQAEIKAVLSASDVDDLGFSLEAGQGNQRAIQELTQTIELMASANHAIVLEPLVQERFGRRPFGWPEWEVVLLVARLLRRGDTSLVLDGDTLSPEKAYEPLTSPSKWRKLSLIKRKTLDSAKLQQARQLAKELFGSLAPDGEEAIDAYLRAKLSDWQADLGEYKTLASSGAYPGSDRIAEALGLLKPLSAETERVALIEQFLSRKNDLLDLADDIHELRHFFAHQRQAWDQLLDAKQRFKANRHELEQDASAAAALTRIQDILNAPSPYGMVKEAAGLIYQIEQVNDALIAAHRAEVLPEVDKQIGKVQVELETAQADQDLRNQCLYPLQQLKKQLEVQTSLAHIAQAGSRALDLADQAFAKIETACKAQPEPPKDNVNDRPAKPYVKPRRVIKPSALAPEGYLETQADIDGYLDRLRGALEKVIAAGDRIEIR
ncbi:MAG: BREX system P-loop protein BrxC, partial [Chromatiaceae bacterium]|nr:BREX system P-loop protein BrxC [Chromatiaceae bacterium]